jgi:hypothetical protein
MDGDSDEKPAVYLVEKIFRVAQSTRTLSMIEK